MPVEIIVPPLSQTSDTLMLLEWLKKPGDKVSKGEALFTVETDKASLEVEAPDNGTLLEVYAKPQSEIAVRSIIGIILKEGETLSENIKMDEAALTVEKSVNTSVGPINEKQKVLKENTASNRLFASPRARKLAVENELDLSRAIPTGVRGMVVENDVRILMKRTPSTNQAESSGLSRVRQVIAKRMLDSHLQTAPVSYMREVDASNLVAFRNSFLSTLPASEIRPSFTDLFIYIICKALNQHPQLNSTYENDQLLQHKSIDLALAVDTDRGLIVPVMRNAQQLTITQISKHREALVKKVITGNISPEDLSGGTITLTNLGALGIDFFTPIINPPQVAILGIGRIREIPAVKAGGIFIQSVLGLALTCDHRIIDGAPAARFLETLSQIIENPGSDWNK